MLGSMLYNYLTYKDIEVYGTQKRDDKLPFYLNIEERYTNIKFMENISPEIDHIVNCIGVTKLDRSIIKNFRLGFYVNAVFPAYLQEFCSMHSIKLIHISTDAVFKGDDSNPYYENHICDGIGDYATSKVLGEIYASNVLNIRCSIVGNEIDRRNNLLEWFLSQKDGETLQGYTNHIWNGVTTLQLSEFCYRIIKENMFDEISNLTNVIHFSPNTPLTKFELLCLFKEIYKKDVDIVPSRAKEDIKRVLNSRFACFYMGNNECKRNIKGEIIKMKDFVKRYNITI